MIAPPVQTEFADPLIAGDSCLIGRFQAMGCPCEIFMDTPDPVIGRQLLKIAKDEALRIEFKFSRYRAGNSLDQIKMNGGKKIEVDAETSNLLDYAHQCFELSDGLFDVTTGILKKIWSFNGDPAPLTLPEIKKLLPLVGWEKIKWNRPTLQMPLGMELDFGGICKEYAADRILALIVKIYPISLLVNLGGDISAWGRRTWAVGIEDVNSPGKAAVTLQIQRGALATSGDTKKYLTLKGQRLGHILDPRTGWPVRNAPRSVTVAAPICTEAGFFSTLAMLHGTHAESFLKQQSVEYWCYR